MARVEISTKRLAINKANARMVGIAGGAAFVTVFCLIATKAVFSQNQYQARVINAKEKAHTQLQANIKAFDELVTSYQAFDTSSPNIIGGSANGKDARDGANSKLVLDSLPGSYDFPALTSSVEKILKEQKFSIDGITGTDDQINQQANASNPNPQPVPMPFTFTVSNASYDNVKQLIDTLQRSIRPIQIDTMVLGGGVNDMTLTVTAHTYYQPGKSLTITKKEIK